MDFIKEVIGEADDSFQYSNYHIEDSEKSNLILMFDTVYLMDEASWKLLDYIKEDC